MGVIRFTCVILQFSKRYVLIAAHTLVIVNTKAQ